MDSGSFVNMALQNSFKRTRSQKAVSAAHNVESTGAENIFE